MSDWDSEHYKKFASAQENRALKYLNSLTFRGDEKVLDIGCGNGKITAQIAMLVPNGRVIGIDISPKMIAQAKQDYPNVPNLEFLQKSAEDFHFPDRFDLIVSFNALHWVDNHQKVLENVNTSLKKGGRFLFLMASGKENQAMEEIYKKEKWRPYLGKIQMLHNRMKDVNYSDLLNKFHFENKCIEVADSTYRFKNVDQLQNHLMTWIPFATDLPYEKAIEFAAELASNFSRTSSGEIDYTLSVLHVEGTIT